ncbi:hypothetical protein [Planococcus soli]|uniref:hypothetical protein n=1 Tax=Planococcus soli TaxID=2666072 RepID=UPI00115CC601|nr:hypothetical protein [Planococcus soli]
MKHLLLKIVVFSIFTFIVAVSDIPTYIKNIFVMAILFFLLPFENHFFTKERMSRKCIAAASGAVIFTSLFLLVPLLFFNEGANYKGLIDFILSFSLILFYALLGFGVYGLPASLFSDWIAEKFSYRLASAAVIHLTFGLLLITKLSLIPIICAGIFWVIDEKIRKNQRKDFLRERNSIIRSE